MKIHLRTLGCRLNQSEIDTMARQFRQQGHEIVEDPVLADWMVVNTCAVTHDAVRSSRHLVRELNRANAGAHEGIGGLRKARDHQPVPVGEHLIVEAWADAGCAASEKFLPH